MILLLAILNSLVVPIELSFAPIGFEQDWFVVLDTVIDGMFFVDMVLMCFTSVINKDGKENKHQIEIVSKYVHSVRFVFDIIALFGTGFVTQF